MATYNVYGTGCLRNTNRTFDNLIDARKWAISQIIKNVSTNKKGHFQITKSDGSLEMVQVRNDGRTNFMVCVRGPGGNKSYTQILTAGGIALSPKISVYAMEYGKGRYPWAYNYDSTKNKTKEMHPFGL